VVFFATLIVVSLFTVRLSDAILDSKIGALDRSLGFLFGAARGFLLGVVAFSIFNWLVAEKQQPEWVKTAKTRPALVDTANWIVAMLPDDAAQTIEGWIKTKNASAAAEEPSDENGAAAAAPAPSPAPAPAIRTDAAAPASGAAAADKQKLDSLINKSVPAPAPAAPAIVPTPLRR
jgi:membrane protein required for colicin V production